MTRGDAPLLGDALVAASGRSGPDQLVGLAVLALAEAIHRLADVQERAADGRIAGRETADPAVPAQV